MFDLPIVDAHHHLADLSRSYPWLEGEPVKRYHGDDVPLRRNYFLPDYLADTKNLNLIGSVHIENGAADSKAEAAWVHQVIRENGLPTAQVAKVDFTSPNAAELLEFHSQFDTVRGIRDILNWHSNPFYTHRAQSDLMQNPTWLANFKLLARYGMSFDLQVFIHQLDEAATLVNQHPEIPVVLDHAGMPIERDAEGLARWQKAMTAFAQTNSMVKISALGTNDHNWTTESIRELVLRTIEIFGVDRVMFASNFPVDGLYSTLDELYSAFDKITEHFTRAEREAMFAWNADRFYKLNLKGN